MSTKLLGAWPKRVALGLSLAALAGLSMRSPSAGGDSAGRKPLVIPQSLSLKAQAGKIAYDANCAQCHGANAAGADHGPPFVHPIYNPGHHPDEAFQYAAKNGVRSHHWNFGDMPPRPEVDENE